MKVYFLFALLACSILLSACGNDGDGFGGIIDTEKNQQNVLPGQKGVNGVEINFLKNSPAETVYEDTPFPFILEFRNFGSYKDAGGIAVIQFDSAIEKLDYPPSSDATVLEPVFENDNKRISVKYELTSNSPDSVGQYSDSLYFTATAEIKDNIESTIVDVTNCYKYQTLANPVVCIDLTALNPTKKIAKACEMKDVTLDSQGAPIAVTTVEVTPTKDSSGTPTPQFIITVENKGTSNPINEKNYDYSCTGKSLSEKDDNIVKAGVSLTRSGNQEDLDCSGLTAEGYLKFNEDKKTTFTCKFKEVGNYQNHGTYLTPLTIKLDYGYVDRFYKEIKLKEIE